MYVRPHKHMRSSYKIGIILCLVVASFFAGVKLTNPSSCGAFCNPQIQSVSPEQFSKLIQDKTYTLIDIRTPQEFAEGHIANAANVDFRNTPQFEQYLSSLDKNGRYLIYCRTGNRSGQALKLMEEKGFINVTDLSEGIVGWQQSGLAVTR